MLLTNISKLFDIFTKVINYYGSLPIFCDYSINPFHALVHVIQCNAIFVGPAAAWDRASNMPAHSDASIMPPCGNASNMALSAWGCAASDSGNILFHGILQAYDYLQNMGWGERGHNY